MTHKPVLFVHMPKTAGQSILAGLRRSGPVQDIAITLERPEHRPVLSLDVQAATVGHSHIPALVRAGVLSDTDVTRCFVFTFVRNPWDRLVSYYHYRSYWRSRQLPYSTFLDQCLDFIPAVNVYSVIGWNQLNSQAAWLRGVNVDFVGKFETLQADWSRLCRLAQMAYLPLPHLNHSSHGDYHEYYTKDTWQRVAERYAEDIERFGYEEDNL